MSDLRNSQTRSKNPWTKEQILAGLNHFYAAHGRYPTAYEIDDYPYLPASRSIQRAFGGLVRLRGELLPLEVANFTAGEQRSEVARRTYSNGRNYEFDFFQGLLTHFEEIAVHDQKVIRPGNVSCDFFIYLTPGSGVVIDIFYAHSIRNLVNIVNIKLKRYSLITQETYLITVGNASLDSDLLSQKMQNKKAPLPIHINVLTESDFKSKVLPMLKARSQFARTHPYSAGSRV